MMTQDMQLIASWILNELKRTPVTLFGMLVLSWVVYGLTQDHVGIKEFDLLRRQIVGVQYTLQHDHIDTRLHQVQSEIFNLSQHINDEKAKGHEVDSLYVIRINDLTNQESDLRHQIDMLDKLGNPAEQST